MHVHLPSVHVIVYAITLVLYLIVLEHTNLQAAVLCMRCVTYLQ